jgi:hypothetical protein
MSRVLQSHNRSCVSAGRNCSSGVD